MGLGSQASRVEALTALTGLTHDVFEGRVVNNVRRESPTAMQFQDATPGEYRLLGQNMVFAADFRFKTGAMATDGKLPDYVGLDAVQGKVTPVRRYQRLAIDNLVERRASGEGSFEDLGDRLFDKMWDAWASMEIRHSIGAATALVGKVSSYTSSTIFVIKDAFGHATTNALAHISKGSILAWYDVSDAQIGGAGTVSDINYSTGAITVTTATTWESAVGNPAAADDLIYFATTPNSATDHFTSERNLAPNGLGTILDPDAALSTVFNIAEANEPNWKPFRKASSTFDHLEVTEFWLKLAAKRGFGVSPQTDISITFPSCVAQLARSLMGYQQQAGLGGELAGGYTGITISGKPIIEDTFFYHDVFATVCKERLYRINLGGDADFWGEDGSMWSRIADYDGKEAFVYDYLNYFSNHRGAHGCLTGITTDVTDADFNSVPSY